MDFIKDLLLTRGVQVGSRYIGQGLTALATYLHVTGDPATVNTSAGFIASLVGAGLGIAIDHFSHAKQAEAAK